MKLLTSGIFATWLSLGSVLAVTSAVGTEVSPQNSANLPSNNTDVRPGAKGPSASAGIPKPRVLNSSVTPSVAGSLPGGSKSHPSEVSSTEHPTMGLTFQKINSENPGSNTVKGGSWNTTGTPASAPTKSSKVKHASSH